MNTNSGNYHIIILPNANMLVHSEQGSVFKHAKNKTKQTKTDESRPKTRLKHAKIETKLIYIYIYITLNQPVYPTYTPKLKIDSVLNDKIKEKRYVPVNH